MEHRQPRARLRRVPGYGFSCSMIDVVLSSREVGMGLCMSHSVTGLDLHISNQECDRDEAQDDHGGGPAGGIRGSRGKSCCRYSNRRRLRGFFGSFPGVPSVPRSHPSMQCQYLHGSAWVAHSCGAQGPGDMAERVARRKQPIIVLTHTTKRSFWTTSRRSPKTQPPRLLLGPTPPPPPPLPLCKPPLLLLPLLLCQKLLLLQPSPTSLRPRLLLPLWPPLLLPSPPLQLLCSLLRPPPPRRVLRLPLLPLLLFLVLSRTKLLTPVLLRRRHLPLPLLPLQSRTSSSSTKLPLLNASKRRPTPSPPPSPATPRTTSLRNKWTLPKGSSTDYVPRLKLWPRPPGFASPRRPWLQLLLRPQPRQPRRVSCATASSATVHLCTRPTSRRRRRKRPVTLLP
ncbi:unnamed protein product [Pylaiella littoralis]